MSKAPMKEAGVMNVFDDYSTVTIQSLAAKGFTIEQIFKIPKAAPKKKGKSK